MNYSSDLREYFQTCKDEGGRDETVLDLLETGLESASTGDINAAARTAASSIKQLDPAFAVYENAEALQVEVWSVIIDLATQLRAREPGQDFLMAVLTLLAAEGDAQASGPSWQNLPYLSEQMRESWNDDPTIDEGTEVEGVYTAQQWLCLNSFAARIQGAGLQKWVNLAVWQLRDALEEELMPGPNGDTRVGAACEWIIHSGKVIFQLCLQDHKMSDAAMKSERAGPLYAGSAGTSLERWRFWHRRLAEVRDQCSVGTIASIDESIDIMGSLQDSSAGLLDGGSTSERSISS